VTSGDLARIREVYERFARGDLRASVPLLAEDVELVVWQGLPDSGSWRGSEGVVDYMRYFLSSWLDLRIEADRIEQVGDRVVVELRQVGTGRHSGVQDEMQYFHVWTLEDGIATRLDVMLDEDDARRAAQR
jgi:ketosteroid isomerase-like protein